MPGNQSQASQLASLSALHVSTPTIRGRHRVDASSSVQTGARTSRLTENKRRYRARCKEYVSNLEQRLVESRQHGIQATKEVQLAAQKVERENARLRELLNLAGFGEDEIRAWLGVVGCSGEPGADGSAWRACERTARACAAAAHRHRDYASRQGVIVGPAAAQLPRRLSPAQLTDDSCLRGGEDTDQEEPSTSYQDHAATLHPPPTTQCTSSQSERLSCPSIVIPSPSEKIGPDPGTKPPCKLLSHLEQNPGADLTQIPVTCDGRDPVLQTSDGEVGVECGRAYKMLMRYATTEEKMDTIAQALEGGCKPDGGGRCAVNRKVVWQVLDRMCG